MKNKRDMAVRTWIEVDTKALKHNYDTFRKLVKKTTKLCAVVKSNAYGHGLVDYAKVMEKNGADWIAVDSMVEGIKLREEGVTIPILVLGYTIVDNAKDAIKHDISIAVSSLASLESLIAMKDLKGIKVHIKVDSGMHRQGFLETDKEKVIEIVKKNKEKINAEGLFTHFAAPSTPSLLEETEKQIEVFELWVHAFKKAGFSSIVHAAATGATLLHPETHYDMVRVGIGLYGHWPSTEVRLLREKEITLKQALTWKSIISEIKSLPAGSRIGYDFTAELHRDSLVAVVPIGYWHGYPRALSNMGAVFVNHHESYVLGRVSMDMLVIDVTDAKAEVGDEVTLLGSESPLLDPDYVGSLAETTNYEMITRLNPLIKKIYI